MENNLYANAGHRRKQSTQYVMRHEDVSKLVVLGEVSTLQIALRRTYNSVANVYFAPKRSVSKSASNISTSEITMEADEDDDDFLYDVSGGQQSGSSQATSSVASVYFSLKQLKEKLTKSFNVINDPSYLKPFCEVIRNKEISGPITGLALQSILKFLNYGLIDYCEDTGAAQLIGESVTKARFIGTDTSSDEVVLVRILNVLKELIVRGFKKLTDETVCEIMQSCFRIAFEPRLSELLRKNAEQALTDMCRTLFAIIDTVNDEINLEEMQALRIGCGSKLGPAFGKRVKGSKPLESTPRDVTKSSATKSNKFAECSSQTLSSNLPQSSNYGLLSIYELLCYLTSLIRSSNDVQNGDLVITVGLNLLIVGFETSIRFIGEKQRLLAIVKNELCWNLLQLLQPDKPLNIFSLSLRLSFIIFTSLRCHLKYQLEAFIIRIIDIINTGNAPFEYREIALEYLYGCFQHINFFSHELFINYDSDPYASNLLEDVLQLLSKNCFSTANVGPASPVNPNSHVFSPIQKVSLNALLAGLRSLQKAELNNSGVLRAFDNSSEMCSNNIVNVKTIAFETPPSPEHVDVGVISQNDKSTPNNDLVVDSVQENSIVTNTESFDNENVSCSHPQIISYGPKKHLKSFPNSLEGIQRLKQRKQLLWTASEQFNAKPTKGIHFLKENKLVNGDLDIVNFLRDNSKLDKKQIGEYLANKKNLNILTAFVENFNFKGLRIDEALRMYLESFRLPGEAPLISLVLEQFAHHWHESNGCPFANEDAAFSLAYAIIMLNVDQHNTNVRRQTTPMTLEEFIANLRQVNNGKDFDSKMLKEIYFAIKNNEIIMPAEQHGVVRERYLWKCLLRRSETESGIYWFAVEDQELGSESSNCTRKVILDKKHAIELSLLNSPIFSILWGPAIAAMTFMFDKININQNSGLARKILSHGFTSCALLCSRYGHLDNLIVSLCKFTVGTGGQSSPLSYYKSQVAAQCLFSIAREYSNEIRESWLNIVELIVSWFTARLLDNSLEIEDFALGGKKIALRRNPVQKSINKNANEGSNFLSSFYSYFAGNQQSEQNGDCSDGDLQQNKSLTKQLDTNNSDSSSQSIHLINTYCQPLSIIEESKFLHIDSLLELIKALINLGVDIKEEEGDDIEAFKLEMLLQIILLNRDRVSVFWPQVSNYLLKLLRICKKSNLLTERVISAIFRLAIRFSQRPDSLSDQAFLLLHHMLVTFELPVIQKQSTAIALHSFITHCHSCISRTEDWNILFELLIYVGIGYRPKRMILRKEGSVEAINVQSETEDDLKLKEGVIRGYTSDSEIEFHAHRISDITKNNPYQLITGCDVGTGKGSCFKIIDLSSYEKCTEILALIIKEILPKNVHLEKQTGDMSVASITNMAVDTLRKFVEASVKIQNNHLRRNASESKRGASKAKNRARECASRSSSDSDDDKSCKQQQQPKLSSVTEACALKLLDLMHFLHLNASFASSNTTNDYLWNTIWSPVLQGIALLCCDARRPVRTCALTFLQRALLNHDLRILTAHQWESCFNKVMFPLLAKLLEPLNICDPIGMDDTRMRATNLLCKVFLQHLTPLLSLPTFTALWLTILDFMDKYMKAEMQTDVVKEAIPESLKNMLLVMDTAQCLNPSLAVITWDRIALFLPNLKEEILPSNPITKVAHETEEQSVESMPIACVEEALTSIVVENEAHSTFQLQQSASNTTQTSFPVAKQAVKGDYPWPAPSESKFNL